MSAPASDKAFTGSIPRLYESHLVPLIFEPYAAELAARLRTRPIKDLLELAAGTGVVTRALAAALPSTNIVATDLNQAMLDEAARIGTQRAVTWQQADALALPFADASFDAVVCQFGVMFFPDKVRAMAEARRVLRPGGVLVFSVWDRLADNEFADVVVSAVATLFPQDPPRFLARTPHGYHDHDAIRRDVAGGGFASAPKIDTVSAQSRAPGASGPAIGYVQGTPMRGEIEARDPARLGAATDVATAAITRRWGHGPVAAKIQALVVTVER